MLLSQCQAQRLSKELLVARPTVEQLKRQLPVSRVVTVSPGSLERSGTHDSVTCWGQAMQHWHKKLPVLAKAAPRSHLVSVTCHRAVRNVAFQLRLPLC